MRDPDDMTTDEQAELLFGGADKVNHAKEPKPADHAATKYEAELDAQLRDERQRSEWAEATERMNLDLDAARRAVEQLASPELIAHLERSGYGSHPAVVKAFELLGKSLPGEASESQALDDVLSDDAAISRLFYGKGRR